MNLPIDIKCRRRQWIPEHKEYVIDLFALIAAHVEIKVKQAVIDSLGPLYEGLKWSQVVKWIASSENEKQKTGPKVNEVFENAVWSRLLITIKREIFDVHKNKTIQQIKVVQNITYSYDIIKGAAKEEQAVVTWRGDQKIQALEFSSSWIHGFLMRADFHRRRITREKKKCPAEDVVQETLKKSNYYLILKVLKTTKWQT